MRLSVTQQQCILQATRQNFGDDAKVWLFGSRVDDTRRGGDVDLGSPQVLMEKNFHFTAPLDCHIQFTTVKEDLCSIAFEASKPSGRSL